MASLIAIEKDAFDIGGSGSPVANKCLTKDRVSAFGNVKIIDSQVNNYIDKQLVAKEHLTDVKRILRLIIEKNLNTLTSSDNDNNYPETNTLGYLHYGMPYNPDHDDEHQHPYWNHGLTAHYEWSDGDKTDAFANWEISVEGDVPKTPGVTLYTEHLTNKNDGSKSAFGFKDYQNNNGQWIMYVTETNAHEVGFFKQFNNKFTKFTITAVSTDAPDGNQYTGTLYLTYGGDNRHRSDTVIDCIQVNSARLLQKPSPGESKSVKIELSLRNINTNNVRLNISVYGRLYNPNNPDYVGMQFPMGTYNDYYINAESTGSTITIESDPQSPEIQQNFTQFQYEVRILNTSDYIGTNTYHNRIEYIYPGPSTLGPFDLSF